MRWTVHGERALYSSPWVSLVLVDVELPEGERFEHHVVRLPAPAASCLVDDPERANVHLVPDPSVPTSETGTRHRTAERVARSIDVPVIAVSEDMSVITVSAASGQQMQ